MPKIARPPAPAPAATPTEAVKAIARAPGSPLLGLVVIGGIVISAIAIFTSGPSSGPSRKDLISQALVKCQYAIQATAKFDGSDMPPYVKNNSRDVDDEFNFGWPRGSFYFTNGFGAREAMSASCTGTLSTGAIKYMTINAKDIL